MLCPLIREWSRLTWLRSYALPHRLNTARVYPLVAPNGLIVIVYGHENGLHAVWTRPSQSGEEDEAVPALGLAVHSIDVHLGGSEALCIDFPRLPTNLHHDTKSIPGLLRESIIVSVACSDYSIRVISLPISPTESGQSSQQVIHLAGEPNHQSIPTCVSVTFTPYKRSEDTDVQMSDGHDFVEQITPRATSRGRRQDSAQKNADWALLIASASPDLSGRLMIHRVPFNESTLDNSPKHCIPWKLHRLVSPAVSVSFSSAVYPSPHHQQLLVAEERGVVRIENYMPENGGSRLVRSLHTDFGSLGDATSSKPRRIFDCRWILEGNAVIVLVTTGEWGVWEFENTGPRSSEDTSLTRGSVGGSHFAISGWVQAKTVQPSTSLGDQKAGTSKFAPMTPSTRKIRQAALFASEPEQSSAPPRGGISVVPSPRSWSSREDDSSVLLWHGTTIISIPSFFTYWQNQVRGSGNLFGTSSKGETKIISNIRFNGERCKEVSFDPCSSELELVITAGRSLIMIESTNPKKQRHAEIPQASPKVTSTDEQLLAEGDLDLFGMDRVLDKMSNGYDLEQVSTGRNGWIKTK